MFIDYCENERSYRILTRDGAVHDRRYADVEFDQRCKLKISDSTRQATEYGNDAAVSTDDGASDSDVEERHEFDRVDNATPSRTPAAPFEIDNEEDDDEAVCDNAANSSGDEKAAAKATPKKLKTTVAHNDEPVIPFPTFTIVVDKHEAKLTTHALAQKYGITAHLLPCKAISK